MLRTTSKSAMSKTVSGLIRHMAQVLPKRFVWRVL